VRLIYLAHPVSGDVAANLERAKRWLAWANRQCGPDAYVIAPWIANIEAGEDDADPKQRQRGLEACCAVVERCDELWLCGGAFSDGMAHEHNAALLEMISVRDLLALGEEPPA
jgi:hypothetical protein